MDNDALVFDISIPGIGDVGVEARDGHLLIRTDRIAASNISVFLNTAWTDTDLAVSVNGTWLKDAYALGQHREPDNLED